MDVEIQFQQPQEVGKSRVVKVDKDEAWELFTSQASNEGRTVVAHFGASWCVTFLSMNYKFEELAQTHPEMLFLFVDGLVILYLLRLNFLQRRQFVRALLGVSSKLGVKAMPTFFLVKGEEVLKKIVGANPDELAKMFCTPFE